jgi:hypothetical protein
MEDEQEDVRKMTDFINNQKATYQSNFQLEFQDFINFKHDISDQEFDEEQLDEEDELNSHDNEVKSYNNEEGPIPVSSLTEEERNVTESCTCSDLKKLLLLNRSKNMQLIKLHKKMQKLLTECEETMEEKNVILKNLETKQFTQQTFVWKLAAPYFKDKKFFPCPLNEDAIKKRSTNELSVYDLVPSSKWTPIEFDRLTNAIKCNYNINRQNDVVHKLNSLKSKMQSEDKDKLEEISHLKQQLDQLKNDEQIPPLNSNEFINWYKVAETFLKDKHTALECQSVWHMLVHPLINKSEWTEEENIKLEAIAKCHLYQNWDEIAVELNTNRTGFTTCLHYFSKLCDKFKKSKFTPEEDAFLLEVVDSYKRGNFIPWNRVVCHFNNRSRHQLYHRYTYFLSQNHVKRGKFSEAEDILLIILVKKFGRNFKKCSEYMPHRSQVQLKSRYTSNLQRHIKKGTFTSEDDKVIYEYAQKYGEKSWSGLTDQLNRCNAQIRQRYKLIKSFLLTNPNSDVAEIPKRKHRFDKVNEDQYNFLNYIADQYKDVDYIPTISMIEESLQVELRTPNALKSPRYMSKKGSAEVKLKNIDTLLTDFFSSSMKIEQNRSITDVNLMEATENVEEILSVLGVNVDIPKDLECNAHLDNIDLEILERISKKDFYSKPPRIDRLLSPNINTLVGLRSLIIKHKEYKTQQKNLPSTSKSDQLLWPMEQNLLKLDEVNRTEILFHRNLFSKRFDTLFNWSAILSLEKPNHFDIQEKCNSVNVPTRTATKTYNRRPSFQDTESVKRRKIDVSALTDLSQHSKTAQLKLVDKSVVEKLMSKKNNINIIRIETVTGSDGIVRPILQQNHQFESQTTPPACPAEPSSVHNLRRDIEDVVDDEDLDDVQKLNVVLKSMKSEVIIDSQNSNNEEYGAMKNDVQLLKEILHYEKIKVKSDPNCL